MSTEEIRLTAIQSVPIAIGAIYLLTGTQFAAQLPVGKIYVAVVICACFCMPVCLLGMLGIISPPATILCSLFPIACGIGIAVLPSDIKLILKRPRFGGQPKSEDQLHSKDSGIFAISSRKYLVKLAVAQNNNVRNCKSIFGALKFWPIPD
jgi:hypothetical protein